jgi:hypothetical protein
MCVYVNVHYVHVCALLPACVRGWVGAGTAGQRDKALFYFCSLFFYFFSGAAGAAGQGADA